MASQVTNHQCPACTGPLQFNPETGKLGCEFCGSVFELAEIEALYAEKDAKAAEAQTKAETKRAQAKAKKEADGDGWDVSGLEEDWGAEADGLRAYNCPSCGAELICDGHHVHPAVVRLAFSLFGGERMILVSDALRCCGMPDGEYELGGQPVFLQGGVARLADGTLAGSAADLFTCMKNAILFGIPEEDAVRACTYNPACALGLQNFVGSIATGCRADFVVCRSDYSAPRGFLDGREVS